MAEVDCKKGFIGRERTGIMEVGCCFRYKAKVEISGARDFTYLRVVALKE